MLVGVVFFRKTAVFGWLKRSMTKGSGKRGHNVADTLLRTQMFSCLPARATFVADTNLGPRHKNVSDFFQKHFVSATNVSRVAQHGNNHEQQCVRNNVFSFATTLSEQFFQGNEYKMFPFLTIHLTQPI